MQWIGAILFIGTTTLIGFDISKTLNKRPQQIRQLKNALQMMEAEILYSQLPLPDVFATITKQLPAPIGSFFDKLEKSIRQDADLHGIWDQHVNELLDMSSLGAKEGEILKQFGRTLGQHDFEQQQKHIYLTLKHLDRELEEARDQQFRYSKMTKTLGILSGIFIVLLLI